MRREHFYLQDILEACDMIQAFLASIDASASLASELHKAATLQKRTVIGGAAAHLSQAFREAHPQVEWCDIVAFRNIAVHTYFAVQWGQRPLMMFRCSGVKSWTYSGRKT